MSELKAKEMHVYPASQVHAQTLEWLELPDAGSVSPAEADRLAADAGDGWRLPTVAELFSCVDHTRHHPAADPEQFPDIQPNPYWTSEQCAWNSSARWVVNFNSGFVLSYYDDYLAVSGDMGEWVFQRLDDMFKFFRSDGGINPSYWAQKCQAADRRGGLKSFSEATARAGVTERIKDAYEDEPDLLTEALEEAASDIKYDDGDIRYYDSCRDFQGPGGRRPFEDFESIPDPMEWSYHYLWICHAIVMGIQKYDEAKAEQVAAKDVYDAEDWSNAKLDAMSAKREALRAALATYDSAIKEQKV